MGREVMELIDVREASLLSRLDVVTVCMAVEAGELRNYGTSKDIKVSKEEVAALRGRLMFLEFYHQQPDAIKQKENDAILRPHE
jgi:hypothetical protein